MSCIGVRGYSERGMINAMMYEMQHAPNGLEMLRNFLKLFVFPNEEPDFDNFQSARIRIEQSFSDFGDLDLLVMLEGSFKQSVLLEAKVKTFQANNWSIYDEWESFNKVVDGTLLKSKDGSNLFVQLYRKMRLINQVKNPDLKLPSDILGERWSLGNNRIVRNAAEELAQYSSKTWFVALVPDSPEKVSNFFKTKLPNTQPVLPDWNINNIGFLSWESLENYCRNFPDVWRHTLSNFDYNKGQIYQSGQAKELSNQTPYNYEDLYVKGRQIVKYDGKICHLSCRGYSFAIRHFQNGEFVEIIRGSNDKGKYLSLKNQIQVIEQAPHEPVENTAFWKNYFSSYTQDNK